MRDSILSTLFVIVCEVGISILAAQRGVEYLRRVVWLQVVLAVLVASHVLPSTFFGVKLVGVYLAVLIGLVVADVEMHPSGKRDVIAVNARDSISVMLSTAVLIAPVIPANSGQSTAFFVGGALAVVYGCLYALYEYAKPDGRIRRSVVSILVGNTALFCVAAMLNLVDGVGGLYDYALQVVTSLMVFTAAHFVPQPASAGRLASMSAPKYPRK